MTARIWFIKNSVHESAGFFSRFAERTKTPFVTVELDQGEKFPEVKKGDAVVILGGPDSANDRTPKILNEIDAIQGLLNKGITCLGICLGLQLLAKAAGGTVFRHSIKEVGFRTPGGEWFEIEKTQAGQQDPLLSGLPDSFKTFQLHGETVTLTPSMARLAQGTVCAEQIVRIQDKVYGIQGHVELDERMLRDLLKEDVELGGMDPVKLRNDFSSLRKELEQSAEVIFKNFLKMSGILL